MSSENISSHLLDSSLIIQSKKKKYYIKFIRVGDYYQLYYFNKPKIKNDSNLERINDINFIDTDHLIKKENFDPNYHIRSDNINRSKFSCQRIIKANENKFKTFITLTFSENISDLKSANRAFNSFRTYIKQKKPDFCYVGVPEFQKRGAVHYHLLTNICYDDFSLLSSEEVKIWKPKAKKWVIGRNIIGWKNGYTLACDMHSVNVVAYLTKYMTKDVDSRLFGFRKFFHSRNLDKPEEFYLDMASDQDFYLLLDVLSNNDIIYENSYLDVFGDVIDFVELKKRGDDSPQSPRFDSL